MPALYACGEAASAAQCLRETPPIGKAPGHIDVHDLKLEIIRVRKEECVVAGLIFILRGRIEYRHAARREEFVKGIDLRPAFDIPREVVETGRVPIMSLVWTIEVCHAD